MDIIVEILVDGGKAGTYKLDNTNGVYRWIYIPVLERYNLKSMMATTLFKNIKERYSDGIGYHFAFEEGDLESLR